MKHEIRLKKTHINAIKKGQKMIELRLYDEMTQIIQVNDLILFKQEDSDDLEITVKVSKLYRADSFEELLKLISAYDCGYNATDNINMVVCDLRKKYDLKAERQYGVIGIEFSEVFWKTEWLPSDKPVLKYICNSKWKRMYNFDWETRNFFTITTDNFVIRITGGSVKFYSKVNNKLISANKGFNYLYTGDVKPDESELMALENGTHFFIFSLKDFSQTKRITLPAKYEAIDVCGKYSKDGKSLYVPVYKYEGVYKYYICEYETKCYTLLKIEPISKEAGNDWKW